MISYTFTKKKEQYLLILTLQQHASNDEFVRLVVAMTMAPRSIKSLADSVLLQESAGLLFSIGACTQKGLGAITMLLIQGFYPDSSR